jgi:hypothetical protein
MCVQAVSEWGAKSDLFINSVQMHLPRKLAMQVKMDLDSTPVCNLIHQHCRKKVCCDIEMPAVPDVRESESGMKNNHLHMYTDRN